MTLINIYCSYFDIYPVCSFHLFSNFLNNDMATTNKKKKLTLLISVMYHGVETIKGEELTLKFFCPIP